MSRLFAAAAMLLLVCSFTAYAAAQAPEPELVSDSWKLDFTYTQPRVIAVPNDQGGTDWYWYIAYKVVNRGAEDVLFFPDFTIATDKGDIIAANTDISPLAFPMIKKDLRNDLVESPAQVIGMIKQGVDYANSWFTPAEVLKMATHDNARLLALSGPRNPYPGKLGVVEEGALADLLLVRGDVLAEIEHFRAELAKHFVTFDPADVDEKLLLDNGLAAAREGKDWIEVEPHAFGGRADADVIKVSVREILDIAGDVDGSSDAYCLFLTNPPNLFGPKTTPSTTIKCGPPRRADRPAPL